MMPSRTAKRGDSFARAPLEIRTAKLEQDPAVRAWRQLGVGPSPARLELLRVRTKSVVYRLPGVGPDGSDVIAKQCLWQIGLDERAVYEVLEELPNARLSYYGFVAEPAGELAWLFVEDARGEPWDPGDAEQRALAARWLAGLHTASSRAANAERLPDRGPGYFRAHLLNARRRIRDGFGNPVLSPERRPVLDAMLELLDSVESRWGEVDAACAAMPRALVHGDFADRNVRMRREGASLVLLAFDWEIAGWGLPAVDLLSVDLSAYASEVRAHWPDLDLCELRRLVRLGELLRGGIAATSWASESLGTSWVEGAIGNLAIYHERITHALAALGWRNPR